MLLCVGSLLPSFCILFTLAFPNKRVCPTDGRDEKEIIPKLQNVLYFRRVSGASGVNHHNQIFKESRTTAILTSFIAKTSGPGQRLSDLAQYNLQG